MPTVVITGANRGLGLALANRFAARRDHTVIATARDLDAAWELTELAGASGGRLRPLALDVCDAAAIEALGQSLEREGAEIDVLINNAGVPGRHEFGEITEADLLEIFRVNTFAPLLVTQALQTRLIAGAKIVNITSVLGSIARAGTGYLPYAMSKAALNMLCAKLAHEMRPRHVSVLALHPGWVQTRMGGTGATLSIDGAADDMLRVIDGHSLERTGAYLAHDGSTIPW